MHRAETINQLTNEKDEFNEPGHSRSEEGGKGKEIQKGILRCDGAGLCEAGNSLFRNFSLRQKTGTWGLYRFLVLLIDLINTGPSLPFFLAFSLILLSCRCVYHALTVLLARSLLFPLKDRV